ncbi:LysR family transcriptional regulator for bpeEF and oprC [Paraburkholderia sp. GAS199]|uniref:LysR family transcriptional regulator n=1 Tax=Paraburkholderia sp. GAS199 TaxID=3035126 RepID=UPI003D20EF2D
MDRLQAMQTFIKIVEMNSFSRAADALGMPRASVTIIIKNLEAHLKVSLMHRTTRRLSLTPEGAQYYERSVRILSDLKECEESLVVTGKGPQGPLRVNMPGSIGRLLVAPRIMEFKERYPDIDMTIDFVDKPMSRSAHAVDCAISSGYFHDPGLMRTILGNADVLTVASPAYISRHGKPEDLHELDGHQAVYYRSISTDRSLAHNFIVDKVPKEVGLKTSLLISDIEAYVTCGLAGAGIIQAPKFLVQNHVDEGLLVEILPQWRPPSVPVSIQYTPDRHLVGRVRVFIEWAAQLFRECPWINTAATEDTDFSKDMRQPHERIPYL